MLIILASNYSHSIRNDPPQPAACYKEILELLTSTCSAAGFPVYLLQQGDIFDVKKEDVKQSPVGAQVPPPRGGGGGGRARGRGRGAPRGGQGGAKEPRQPAWQVLDAKKSKLCMKYNLGG